MNKIKKSNEGKSEIYRKYNDTFVLFIIFILCSPLVAAYASTGREGGLRSKSTLAYLEGGRVKNLIFFAYVICGWPPKCVAIMISKLYPDI